MPPAFLIKYWEIPSVDSARIKDEDFYSLEDLTSRSCRDFTKTDKVGESISDLEILGPQIRVSVISIRKTGQEYLAFDFFSSHFELIGTLEIP